MDDSVGTLYSVTLRSHAPPYLEMAHLALSLLSYVFFLTFLSQFYVQLIPQ